MIMNLPIRFPSDEEVITEEVASFRALSPERRVQELGEMFSLYHFLGSTSGRAKEVERLGEDEEARQRRAIMEFAARHA
jgi:hypothetical protein